VYDCVVLRLIACANPRPDTLRDPPEPAASSPGWTIDAEEPCTAPVATADWTDGSPAVVDYPPPAALPDAPEPGGIAVVETTAGTWLVWGRPEDTAAAWNLTTGELREDVSWGPAAGFAVADLDGDGAMDLVQFAPRIVSWSFGTPAERITAIGDGTDRSPREIALADLDGDDDLDLVYVYGGGVGDDPETMRVRMRMNLGDRAFGDLVGIEGGVGDWGAAFDVTVRDFDGDGAPDVYVCNDHGQEIAPNRLFHNDGTGRLAPALDQLGLDLPQSCMGVAWGDADADGTLDAYLSVSSINYLLLGSDTGFYDAAAANGLVGYPGPRMAWGASFGDLDNDGREDLVAGTSCFRAPGMEPFSAFWWMQGDEGFVDEDDARGIALDSGSRGVVLRDLNGDGVLDAALGDALRSPWVYLSTGCTADAWVEVDGPPGSTVVVESEGVARAGLLAIDSGWASSAGAHLHIGLGDARTIDRITLTPPWGDPVVLEGPLAPRRRVSWEPG
jgi:hypothetical protein